MIYLLIIYYIFIDSFFNYYIIRWNESGTVLRPKPEYVKMYSAIWHGLGALKYLLLLTYLMLVRISIYDIPLFLSMRWILFDLLLNMLRGKKFLYIGSGSIDIFFKRYIKFISPEIFMFLIKIILLIFTIIIHYRYGTEN